MLKAVYESLEDIPEAYRDLYEKHDDVYKLVGIEGVKTQKDIDALQGVKTKLSDQAKTYKEQIRDLNQKLSNLEAQQSAADAANNGSNIDQETLLAFEKLKRDYERQSEEKEILSKNLNELTISMRHGKIVDAIRKEASGRIRSDAIDDIANFTKAMFTIDDDGNILTNADCGDKSGLGVKDFLADYVSTRPFLQPTSNPGTSFHNKQGNNAGSGNDKQQSFLEMQQELDTKG